MLLFEYGVLGRWPAPSDRLVRLRSPGASAGLLWTCAGACFPGEHLAGVVLTALLVAAIGVLASLDVLGTNPC
jgi:hypothetical protein